MKNKSELLREGQELMSEFCEANSLLLPSVTTVEASAWRFRGTCAYYRQDKITICPSACAHIGVGGAGWSYPGYIIDRTPYGVIQHELGHHVDFSISDQKGSYGGDFSTKMRRATGEEKLTNYCPDDWEWFAEMFRLFVTNSDLLRAVRPRTHDLLREKFKPVVDQPFTEVLRDAPERTKLMSLKRAVN